MPGLHHRCPGLSPRRDGFAFAFPDLAKPGEQGAGVIVKVIPVFGDQLILGRHQLSDRGGLFHFGQAGFQPGGVSRLQGYIEEQGGPDAAKDADPSIFPFQEETAGENQQDDEIHDGQDTQGISLSDKGLQQSGSPGVGPIGEKMGQCGNPGEQPGFPQRIERLNKATIPTAKRAISGEKRGNG